MAIQVTDKLTPREYEQHNQRKEMFEMEAQHQIMMQQLDIEVRKIEARWTSLLRLPVIIITLPVRFVVAIAYVVAVARKFELGDNFWTYMRKW